MNEATLMQSQMAMAQSGNEPPAQQFKMEKEYLEMMSHRYDLEDSETRLLESIKSS